MGGILDTDFGADGMAMYDGDDTFSYTGESLARDSNGNIYVVGHSSAPNGYTLVVCKFNSTGQLDTEFGNSGIVQEYGSGSSMANFAKGFDIIVDSDDILYVCGYRQDSESRDIAVYSYDSSGSRNSEFSLNGAAFYNIDLGGLNSEEGYAMTSDSDGNFYIAGYVSGAASDDFIVLKINANGVLVTDFGTDGYTVVSDAEGTDVNEYAHDIVLDSTDRICIAGYGEIGGNEDMVIIWLKSDGSLDTASTSSGYRVYDGIAGGSGHDAFYGLSIGANDRIYAAGYSEGELGKKVTVMRLGVNGVLDLSFGTNGSILYNNPFSGGFSDEGRACLVTESGHIYVTGFSENSSSNNDTILLRYY